MLQRLKLDESCKPPSIHPTLPTKPNQNTTHKFIIRRNTLQNQPHPFRRNKFHPLLRMLRVRSREVPRPVYSRGFGVAVVHDVVHVAYWDTLGGSSCACACACARGLRRTLFNTSVSHCIAYLSPSPIHHSNQNLIDLPYYPTPPPHSLASSSHESPYSSLSHPPSCLLGVILTISPQTTSLPAQPTHSLPVKYPSLPATISLQLLFTSWSILPASCVCAGDRPNRMHLPMRDFRSVRRRGLRVDW